MRKYHVLALAATAGALVAGCLDSSFHPEVITLVASDEVVVVDPETVVEGQVRVVGKLPVGASAAVVECRPRKSDIDVLVQINGKTAVVWQGKYSLDRRAARKGDAAASTTSSCWGLLKTSGG
jgi:hypothetical protein